MVAARAANEKPARKRKAPVSGEGGASEELEAEMDVGVGSKLEKGVVVAVEARHAEWGNHAYFLAKAVGKAFTLKRAKTDAYKNKFKKGDEVFEGTRRHPIATPIHSTEVVE